ncbi:hypothetical protein ELI_3353 [Eubacterium callanderi]|uniref:Uncharacterized protein n=1 Tax=Eubacterium callanderi TaxID=53442 RepID=E3GFI0_9FIRM|nr:hypothetical protein ELI_3353 [Eubacterium callanderi]
MTVKFQLSLFLFILYPIEIFYNIILAFSPHGIKVIFA